MKQRITHLLSPAFIVHRSSFRVLLSRLHSDDGTVSVSFILVLPLFLLVFGVIIQYALLVNAKIMVDQAALSAARTAATFLPTDPQIDFLDPGLTQPINALDMINRSARIQLVPLSPASKDNSSAPEEQAIETGFTNAGVKLPSSFAPRYAYASQATKITLLPVQPQLQVQDYPFLKGQEIQVQVTYQFYLTVPGARDLIGAANSIAGINGRFFPMVSTVPVQTAHGRQATVNAQGWPQ